MCVKYACDVTQRAGKEHGSPISITNSIINDKYVWPRVPIKQSTVTILAITDSIYVLNTLKKKSPNFTQCADHVLHIRVER
jgi:hypothetical protein